MFVSGAILAPTDCDSQEGDVIRRIAIHSVFLALMVCGAALGLQWPAVAHAQEDVTVQGEIVDMACYMAKGSRGASHKACAQLCAKRGVPLGVLTDGGEVFLLLDDHNNPDPYEAAKKLAGERAEIGGKKFSKQGVASIVVGSVKGL
jgi:hypothetical protein